VSSLKHICGIVLLSVLFLSAAALSSAMSENVAAAWVLEVTGTASGTGSQGKPISITVGMALSDGTVIKAGSSSTVRILYREQGVFTIRDGETHTVSSASKTAGSLGKSFGNLMEMIAGKFQNRNQAPVHTKPTGKSGGDSELRILPVMQGSSAPMLPVEGDLLSPNVTFQWGGKDHPEKYTIVLCRSDEKGERLDEICRFGNFSPEEIQVKKYADNITVCRFIYYKSEYNLKYDEYYQWGVTRDPNGQPDTFVWFHIIPYSEETAIREKCGEIRTQLGLKGDSRSITGSILSGALFESKRLYTDAWQEYQSAIDAVEPGNDKEPYEKILRDLSDKIRKLRTGTQDKTGLLTLPGGSADIL